MMVNKKKKPDLIVAFNLIFVFFFLSWRRKLYRHSDRSCKLYNYIIIIEMSAISDENTPRNMYAMSIKLIRNYHYYYCFEYKELK